TLLDRAVALKVVAHPERDRHALARFAIEARALARVQHPNVVAAYRAGKVDHRPYLAQELLVGERLDEIPRPAPWPQVVRWGRDLARAVAAAHARGVIHRDIKPGNIMLVGGRRVKLFDFGLAHILDGARLDLDPPRTSVLADLERPRLTAYGSIAGTPVYLAPELWDGGEPTARSDCYALGLSLYELLTGALPHGHLRGIALVQASRAADLPGVHVTRPDIPGVIADLVDRSVARDPAARPASVAALRDAFEAFAGDPALAIEPDDEPGAMARGALDQRPTEIEVVTPRASVPLTRPGRVGRRTGG
ncbi:MAG: serine/threonine protein kinase, partial [Deltaproteobacteria bacterium]|nr:serine/threonine protein kinase [Deltaproteobacteria bacterium]